MVNGRQRYFYDHALRGVAKLINTKIYLLLRHHADTLIKMSNVVYSLFIAFDAQRDSNRLLEGFKNEPVCVGFTQAVVNWFCPYFKCSR